MNNVLAINTSLNGTQGNSNQLVEHFLDKLAAKQQTTVTVRDLVETDLPHLSAEEMAAWMTPQDERNAQQASLASLSDSLVEELQQADTLVLGMPMYNFGVPSAFKAWIDRVARAGITFRYTESGPQGLLTGKRAYVLAARGGMYAGTEKDSQTQYLRDVLAFLGIEDVTFVYAEGLAMGPSVSEQAIANAEQKISELIEKTAA
ncbi:NAD(P)H-dependent oxidoreductase [Aestuariibacter halophilus]|uniref:FMN dependent NADH:quinone oxidoreductase n=1 Tax=Fluctibacter halophilus TaxID=226011 RepID=A0ABS8G985_9ALTE|nr:NAD(P)H-dependent oxidoreductase [Aestuariibacter halophilus]MCC2615766.1 NAD(P)H-dependent oxidoreductase [Aestuariibacter halophilus]